MKTWIIPYIDQDLSFWQEIASRFKEHIRAVYFPMQSGVASGRPPLPDRFMEVFLRQAPLPKTVLVNPIILTEPAEQVAPRIIDTLRRMREDYGVESATVANPTLARLIRQAMPDFHLGASILMGISTPAQALVVSDYLDMIVPDNRILRDLRSLKRLRQAFKGEIRLIVNEGCLPGCLYRTQHFYEMGYADFFPQSLCQQTLEERPWLRLTGGWILPQHLHYYDGLFDSLKLAGRVTLRLPEQYFAVLGAYIQRQKLLPSQIGGGPASVIEDFDLPDEAFEHMLRCNKACHACSFCQETYEKARQH